MEVNTYLNFDGRCKEAFEFYESKIGAKIQSLMTHGDSPMIGHSAPDWNEKILHGSIAFGDSVVLGSDSPPEYYNKPQGTYVTLRLDTPEQAEQVFSALSEGGQVSMPIQETFWAHRFGMVTDCFDIPWMINCNKPM